MATHAHTAGGDDSDTSDQNDVESEKVQYSNPVHRMSDDDDNGSDISSSAGLEKKVKRGCLEMEMGA